VDVTGQPPRRIEVHIENLVLHGFDPRQRHAIADAVEAELARLLAAEPIGPATEPPGSAAGGDFSLEPGAPAGATGVGVAAVVRRAIGPAISGAASSGAGASGAGMRGAGVNGAAVSGAVGEGGDGAR
jgi:hypothetical protein